MDQLSRYPRLSPQEFADQMALVQQGDRIESSATLGLVDHGHAEFDGVAAVWGEVFWLDLGPDEHGGSGYFYFPT